MVSTVDHLHNESTNTITMVEPFTPPVALDHCISPIRHRKPLPQGLVEVAFCLGFIEFGKIMTLLIYFYCCLCFQHIARPPSTMVAKAASIVDGRRPNNTDRLITYS